MKKKILYFLLPFTALLLLFGVRSYAAQNVGEYIVCEGEGEYLLYDSSSVEPQLVFRGESLSRVISSAVGAVRLTLDGVTLSEPLELSDGAYELVGDISIASGGGITVCEGASLSLTDLNITVSDDCERALRVKGGSLAVIGATHIYSSVYTPITVDFSSVALLTVTGGRIECEYASAIASDMGTVRLLGGEIVSRADAAVRNKATLTVAGARIAGSGYDLISDTPIRASYGGVYNTENISLMLTREFYEGTLTEVIYNASPETVKHFSVYDENGRAWQTAFYDSHRFSDNKSFCAVYLPHTVSYYDKGEKIETEELVSGLAPTVPNYHAPRGYLFGGWYADESLTVPYDFTAPIAANSSVYLKKTLAAAEFSLSSLSFTYDTSARTLSFDKLAHPLESVGFYSFEWYKNGEYISSSRDLKILSVLDSGSYFCKVRFSYNGDFSEIVTPAVEVSVKKRTVEIPAIEPTEYTGYALYSELPPSLIYSADTVYATDSGSYSVRLTLTDSDNYAWEGASGAVAYTEFIIKRAENCWWGAPAVSPSVVGVMPKIDAVSKFGVPKPSFSSTPGGVYSEMLPTASGRHYLRLTVEGTDNYTELISEPIPFDLSEECVTGIYIRKMPNKLEYIAFERFVGVGISVEAEYNSGRCELVGIESLSVSYQRADSFRFGDSSVTVSYGGLSLSIPVSVSRASYDISGAAFYDITVVYDGEYKTAIFNSPLPTGLDGIPLLASVVGGGVGVGEYSATLVFRTESENYKTPEPISVTVRILPFEADVVWSSESFVYNGKAQAPSAYFINERGVKIRLSAEGAAIFARDGYTARVSSPSPNYILRNTEIGFSIARADYDTSAVRLEKDSFVYDGTQKGIALVGLPEGITLLGFADGFATEVGVYSATALFDYDEANYNEPRLQPLIYRITPAEYDLSGMEFLDKLAVYDGGEHYPELIGTPPVGIDGIPLSFGFDKALISVTDGKVAVGIVFYTESKNYKIPETIYRSVEITPMPITVEWSGAVFTYSGAEFLPSADSPHTAITVFGGAVNAGSYTAIAKSNSKNYTVVNSEYRFVIKKAQNSWTCYPVINDIYEGGEIRCDAEAIFGEPVIKFYKDEFLQTELEAPELFGEYFAVVSVTEGDNYLELVSSPIRFQIIKRVPIELSAVLLRDELYAFERLGFGDFALSALYNDGTVSAVSPTLATLIYESADSLRAADGFVRISYGGVECRLSVSVSKASYDMSGVKILGEAAVYDGLSHTVSLSGLPEGVWVREISGGVGIGAGEYPFTVFFGYDSENYNEPTPIGGALTVKKKTVPLGELESVVYNGKIQLPSLPEGVVALMPYSPINAGEYTLTLTLTDTENYEFVGGDKLAKRRFTITKAPLLVVIGKQSVYLFEEPITPEYSVTGVLGEDDPMLSLLFKGDRFVPTAANLNYEVSYVGGEVERIESLGKNGMRTLLICILLFTISILFAYILIKHRDEIFEYFSKRRASMAYRATVAAVNPEPISQPIAALPDGGGEYYSMLRVDMPKADSLISDTMAKNLIKRSPDPIVTRGWKKAIVNIGAISSAFSPDEYVDINRLKERGLVGEDVGYIKVLADGVIDKPLFVYANSFSLSAVKMIALTGGEAMRVSTHRPFRKNGKIRKKG